MDCPKCGKTMVVKKSDTSYNFDVKPEKKYKRVYYCCEADDVWITLETPLETPEKNQ